MILVRGLMLNFSDIIAGVSQQSLSALELKQLISVASDLLAEKQIVEAEAQEDLNTSFRSLSISEEIKSGLVQAFEKEFTQDFTCQYLSEDTAVEATAVSSGYVRKKIGLLEIVIVSSSSLSGECDSLVFHGLTQEKCRLLLSEYFQIPTRPSHTGLSVVDTVLDQTTQKFTPVNLVLGTNFYCQVSLCFRSVEGLQFIFDQKTRGSLQKKQEAFVAKLRDFIEEEYSLTQSAFTVQLLVDNQAIEFANEFTSSKKKGATISGENILAEDVSFIVTDATDFEPEPSVTITKETSGQKAVGRDSPGESVERVSDDSSVARGAILSKDFYVKATVDERTAGLSLAVGTARPGTYLGRRQGAHITAYTVFVRAVLEAVDEKSIHEIPNLLLAIAKQFGTAENFATLTQRVQALPEVAPRHFDREYRKTLTAHLRQSSVDEKTIQDLKKSMKIHHATLLANLIDDLSTQVLIDINQNESVLYLRPGKTDSSALGAEGAKVRAAMQGLRAIQQVIRWQEKEPSKQASLLEKFKQDTARQGLKSFLNVKRTSEISDRAIDVFFTTFYQPQEEIRASAAVMSSRTSRSTSSAFFQSASSSEQERLEGIACSTLRVISELIFNLFDFDYYEYTTSLIITEIYQRVHEKYKEGDINNPTYKHMKEIMQVFEGTKSKLTLMALYAITGLSSLRLKATEEENIEIKLLLPLLEQVILIKVDLKAILTETIIAVINGFESKINQYFEFVIQSAFPGMKTLPEACLNYINQQFARAVLNKMHWNVAVKKDLILSTTTLPLSFSSHIGST